MTHISHTEFSEMMTGEYIILGSGKIDMDVPEI